MKAGIVVFPGSNCDQDCYHAFNILGQSVEYVWHTETDIDRFDLIVLPGGFSYGDYLRCGAIASHSSIIKSIKEHTEKGKLILGICNGFQILTEIGLLPGALLMNNTTTFICKFVEVAVVNINTPFTKKYKTGVRYKMPIAHKEGNYYIEDSGVDLIINNQMVFKYVSNPNGSKLSIAGIINKEKNVLGMMPHPERCAEKILTSQDGLPLFQSIIEHIHG